MKLKTKHQQHASPLNSQFTRMDRKKSCKCQHSHLLLAEEPIGTTVLKDYVTPKVELSQINVFPLQHSTQWSQTGAKGKIHQE